MISGSEDRTIQVWSAPEGRHEATLTGHTELVASVVVVPAPSGAAGGGGGAGVGRAGPGLGWLVSASVDQTIRVWALGSWEALRVVRVCEEGTGRFVRSLVVAGPGLVVGGTNQDGPARDDTAYGLLCWEAETMEQRRGTAVPAGPLGAAVWHLARGAGGRLWGGVGCHVVAWVGGVGS